MSVDETLQSVCSVWSPEARLGTVMKFPSATRLLQLVLKHA